MSIITNFSDLDLTKQYSYSDFLRWQFQERVELIRGFIRKMSPAPSMVHQRISNNLSYELNNYFKRTNCDVFQAPLMFDCLFHQPKKNLQWYSLIYVSFVMKAN